jgi:tetratricopeptide (TPR) repeat protein
MSNAPSGKTQLSSWKEVAAYLKATPRTAMRWERERGLPIRRLPGESRSRVYAHVDELKAWLESNVETVREPIAAPSPSEPAQRPAPARRLALAAAALVAAVGLLAAAVLMGRDAPPNLSAEAQIAYDTANQNFDRRTPAALAAAIGGFERVIALAPNSPEGFAGLASVYAIMPEYTAMGAAAGYAKAEQNARLALARNPRHARAHAVFAFARFYGAQDVEAADASFARAVALEPENVQARHWRATFLFATGKFDAALAEIDAALALDPASQAIAADRAAILAHVGRREESVAILKSMIAKTPDFRSPHAYLAQIAFDMGDDATFVRESRIRAKLQNDLYGVELADAAEQGLAQGGRRGMLEALRDIRQSQFESGVGSAIEIARLHLELGDRRAAERFLNVGLKRREPEAAYLALYPGLAKLRAGGAS